MKTARIFLAFLFVSGSILLLSTCKKVIDENKVNNIVKNKLSGLVQKGPFVNGSSIQMYELNSSLAQTGKIFNTQIINNKGSFEIDNIALSSQYVEFIANGYYFNEVTGDISPSPLSLYALSDITDLSSVNVNILTHLEKSRVEYLVGKGLTFAAAKDSAQKEVLAIFGFQANNMDQSEKLDISVNKQENAILLAISLILQGNRSVGDLTELLANISTDIQKDGKLDDKSILTGLRTSTLGLDMSGIRSNLQNRYKDLGDSTTIPGFETYLNDFLTTTGSGPSATTLPATNITATGATLNGIVYPNNLLTTVKFEYGTTTSYGSTATATQSPISGNTSVNVSADLTGLTEDTIYHFRVVAVDSSGTTYGNDVTFSYYTVNYVDSVTDVDGNVYKAVKIGSQIWMAENLKTTKYNDNTAIPLVTDNLAWAQLTTPGYCFYANDDLINKSIYGALYNGYAVNTSKLCPTGWHIPSDNEWLTLESLFGGGELAGGALKEKGYSHWQTPNTGATNESGFTGLPGGFHDSGEYGGIYNYLGTYGYWWTSDAYIRDLRYDGTTTDRHIYWGDNAKNNRGGFSVRCVKN
jgi:uncharacterized protein (TIGR02145 family)